jgi:predicted chitinase
MPAVIPKISYPIPSNEQGQAFSNSDELLDVLAKESSGQYLVGSQGMWHGGIHITDATAPWCALSARTEAEQQYRSEPYKGAQFIRCMADGEIVAYRVDKAYPSIPWRDENLYLSTSFVLVKHYVQPGENAISGLTFYTLYMNLAPLAAYAPKGERDRKTADRLSYYSSADDVKTGSSAKAGILPVGIRVTLGDQNIAQDSSRGRRQFGEVIVTEEAKDAAGVTLSAGTRIWILTDRGNLKAVSSTSASPPPWWAKCSPAYSAQPAGVVQCKTRTDWPYYLSSEDVLQGKAEGSLAANFPLSYETGNATQQAARPSDGCSFNLMTLGKDVGKQKKGDRVWVVSDGDSLTPAGTGDAKFGEVVDITQAPIKISAGDGIGHMGFYQLPEEHGKRSRYQVHIECLSMDDKQLPTFLTNPDKVGELTPAYLKYAKDAPLFIKNAEGQMVDSTRKTLARSIVTLSKVPVVEKDGQPAYYQIHKENGYLAAASVHTLSQYALGELGFVTLDKAPASFDLIDGIRHPDNVVKGILEQMYKAAEEETRTSHALNKYNYQRLLNQIDKNQDGYYSEEEYLQAVHIASYRDALYRIIAKHGSEWYYGKGDPLWKTYLDTLIIDAPLWKTYTEAFIDKITWMKQVAGMESEPWHLHPVVFLGAFNVEDGVTYAQLKRIFPQASDSDINTVVSELRGKLKTFKLDTPTRLRHFFSQIKGEVGDKMKGETENFQFSPDTLRSFSRYYRQHSAEADQDGYERNSAGRTTRRADEQAIGRKHYLRLNGNRQSNPDDGYNFRGRGLIQITGYEKYNGFFTEYHNYWSGDVPDVVNQPEKINEMPYAIHSALWYWIKYKPYNADTGRGYDDVADVTKIVNGADMGLAKRREAYRLCEQVFL